MDFFKTMDRLMQGFDVNIIIAKNHDTPDGKLTVSVLPKSKNEKQDFKPFLLNGLPADLDENFEQLFTEPAQQITSMVDTAKKYTSDLKQKEAKEAEERKNKLANKPGSSTSTAKAKEDQERKEKSEKYTKLQTQAEKYATEKNYFAAIGFYKECLKIFPGNAQALKRIKELEEEQKKPQTFDMFATTTQPVTVDVTAEIAKTLATVVAAPEPAAADPEPEDPDQDDPDQDDEDNTGEECTVESNDQVCDPNK